MPLPEQDGPENETQNSLTELSAKELAYHLTIYENQLFRSVSVVSYLNEYCTYVKKFSYKSLMHVLTLRCGTVNSNTKKTKFHLKIAGSTSMKYALFFSGVDTFTMFPISKISSIWYRNRL